MKHLLNICNINGAEVEPVDVIIGGSPCQDLSVAGKRAGLDGERSGLFLEHSRRMTEIGKLSNRAEHDGCPICKQMARIFDGRQREAEE